MAKKFDLDDILGEQSRPSPAGLQKPPRVVMLPIQDLQPNPENEIYTIGDLTQLKADIARCGLRQPIEVIDIGVGEDGERGETPVYMILAGHRRWMACTSLYNEGEERFAQLPCIITESRGEDEDLISLITSNATARELTDGERLKQYAALKAAFERKKAAGTLDGRVRDALCGVTGEGAGTLGRLNAILAHCTPEVIAAVEDGSCSITKAYECSKLFKVQQGEYLRNGYSCMPVVSRDHKAELMDKLTADTLAERLAALDYTRGMYGYFDDCSCEFAKTKLQMDGWVAEIWGSASGRQFDFYEYTDMDAEEPIAGGYVYPSELFARAKKLYGKEECVQADTEDESPAGMAQETTHTRQTGKANAEDKPDYAAHIAFTMQVENRTEDLMEKIYQTVTMENPKAAGAVMYAGIPPLGLKFWQLEYPCGTVFAMVDKMSGGDSGPQILLSLRKPGAEAGSPFEELGDFEFELTRAVRARMKKERDDGEV